MPTVVLIRCDCFFRTKVHILLTIRKKNALFFAVSPKISIFAADYMNYSELTQQWLDIADQDLKVAELTHANGYWLYAAFLCHQALEKALKAFWTATLDTNPPYTHSHAKLLEGSGLLDRLSEKQLQFIALMVPMYIEARYPSYKQRMASTLNETSSNYIINSTKEMIGWIKQQL